MTYKEAKANYEGKARRAESLMGSECDELEFMQALAEMGEALRVCGTFPDHVPGSWPSSRK